MSNLPDERRGEVVALLRDVLDTCTCTPYPMGDGPEIDCPMHGRADLQGLACADALAPMLAGWLAEERAKALREAADDWRAMQTHRPREAEPDAVEGWLRNRADNLARNYRQENADG